MLDFMKDIFKLYDKGLHQEVVHSIDLASFSAAGDPRLAQVLAASYFHLGQYSEALLLLREIESCFSDDSNYLSLYGACLRRCGNFEDARLQLEMALKLKPHYAPFRNNYANLLIDLDDYQQAESILVELLDDDPDYIDAQVNLRRLKERQQIQQLQPTEEFNTESAWTFSDPLMLAFDEDEVKRTRPKPADPGQINSDLKGKLPALKDQQIASDQLTLALKAVQEGRYVFALQLCSQVHHSTPTSSGLFECISDAYIALKRFTEAETCLLHALQLGSRSFKLYANLTSLLCIRRDFPLAQYYFEQASLLDEANPLLSKLRVQIAKGQKGSKLPIVRFDQEWNRPNLTVKES